MEFLNINSPDNVIVVTNVEFSETFFLPLLFENKKRSGGGDITSVYYDEKLKQFLIAFNSNDVVKRVKNFGIISYNGYKYRPYTIDNSKILINCNNTNNTHEYMELLAENLLQDSNVDKKNIDRISSNWYLISISDSIDFKQLNSRINKFNFNAFTVHVIVQTTTENEDVKNIYFPVKDNSKTFDFTWKPETKSQVITIDDCASGESNLGEINNSDVENGSMNVNAHSLNNLSLFARTDSNHSSQSEGEIQAKSSNLQTSQINSSTKKDNKSVKLTDIVKIGVACAEPNYMPAGMEDSNSVVLRVARLENKVEELNRTVKELKDAKRSNQTVIPNNNDNTKNLASGGSSRDQATSTYHHNLPSTHKQTSKVNRWSLSSSSSSDDDDDVVYTAQSVLRTQNTIKNLEKLRHRLRRNRQEQIATNNNEQQTQTNATASASNVSNTNVLPVAAAASNDYRLHHMELRKHQNELLARNSRIAQTLRNNNEAAVSQIRNSVESDPDERLRFLQAVRDRLQYRAAFLNLTSDTGLTKSQIERFPIIEFNLDETNSSNKSVCPICLEIFKNNERIRVLSCFDKFHISCIDRWLETHKNCPCCKHDVLKFLNEQTSANHN